MVERLRDASFEEERPSVTELRREPILRRWVVITSRHWEALMGLLSRQRGQERDLCPFCPGHEAKTPPEVFAIRDPHSPPNGKGWRVRVVPNKFPFFRIEGAIEKSAAGIYDRMTGIGAHEIVIETPAHEADWSTIDAPHLEGVLRAYRERSLDLRRDKRFRQIVIARNYGPGLALLSHPHSHVVALTVIPKRIEEELRGALEYYERKERCPYCDTIRQELQSGERVIRETKAFLAFAPFAARYPLETWIIPKAHGHDFGALGDLELKDLAVLLQDLVGRIRRLLLGPPYSLVLHTSPLQTYAEPRYHWHLELRVRLPIAEGFEWGTGFFVNPIAPEEAAKRLRAVAEEGGLP